MRQRSRWRRSRTVSVGALLVCTVAAGCSGGQGGDRALVRAESFARLGLASAAPAVDLAPGPADPPGAPARSPEDAVARFVAAETAGDVNASYGLLSESARQGFGTRAAWAAAHATMPRLRSFTASAPVARTLVGTTLTGDAAFEPRLDEVVGLVPASAVVTWRLVQEDGGWRVDQPGSTITPTFILTDDALRETVIAWLSEQQRCTGTPSVREYGGGLVGAPALARALCRTTDAADIASVGPLGDKPDPSAVIAAFGPDADRWARVAHVRTPRALDVVLAPFDDRWIVIAVLDPRH